jgi:enolase
MTREAVIRYKATDFYDSAPFGSTVGFKETQSRILDATPCVTKLNKIQNITDLTQEVFDSIVCKEMDSQMSTAFSLAFLKLLAYKFGNSSAKLHEYLTAAYATQPSSPRIICNILNGSKHAYNNLTFCEFMIIPNGKTMAEKVRIAAEVYADLQQIIVDELGESHLFLGREGGFSPVVSNVEEAIDLLGRAICMRNGEKCNIALDVAANNFSELQSGMYIYTVNEKQYTTNELVRYYTELLERYPAIGYLEDPFHEDDIDGWHQLFDLVGDSILVVADDLTVSKTKHIRKYKKCFNTCILKANQAGSVTELVMAYRYCVAHGIKTIVSQRSGETDSNVLAHLAVGLGSDYIKAGAPARERIVKYNELLRIAR